MRIHQRWKLSVVRGETTIGARTTMYFDPSSQLKILDADDQTSTTMFLEGCRCSSGRDPQRVLVLDPAVPADALAASQPQIFWRRASGRHTSAA